MPKNISKEGSYRTSIPATLAQALYEYGQKEMVGDLTVRDVLLFASYKLLGEKNNNSQAKPSLPQKEESEAPKPPPLGGFMEDFFE